MARVTIGGTEYEVPEMNFIALERAWPFVEEAMMTTDPMKGVAAGICIIAAGLVEADYFDKTHFGIEEDELLGPDQTFDRVVIYLKKQLKAREIQAVRDAVDQINEEAGLEPAKGEAPGPGTDQEDQESPPSDLTETAPTMSQSSSPPGVREAAGS